MKTEEIVQVIKSNPELMDKMNTLAKCEYCQDDLDRYLKTDIYILRYLPEIISKVLERKYIGQFDGRMIIPYDYSDATNEKYQVLIIYWKPSKYDFKVLAYEGKVHVLGRFFGKNLDDTITKFAELAKGIIDKIKDSVEKVIWEFEEFLNNPDPDVDPTDLVPPNDDYYEDFMDGGSMC